MNPGVLYSAIWLSHFIVSAETRAYHDVIWNSRFFNENFKFTKMHVRLGDQLTIVCPESYHQGMNYEYAKLYWVSEKEWEQCYTDRSQPFGVCGDEDRTETIKLNFRSRNPIPGGMEFEVGKTYYLISTSTGEAYGINNVIGGLCTEHQMRIAIEIIGGQVPVQQMRYEVHEYQSLSYTAPISSWLSLLCLASFVLYYYV
ncbi:CRE-EFN-3 protein [Caenorhabditis remanei]|uniref:CRE-EFN-3 protein n=1 Tax=Caenorhabditis remanei TaxID=31234 RepID=E3MDX9_CAERE|nr:CRE-EFN-3 protein [Caenorhabditis remanei]